MPKKDLYEVLGVSKDASVDDIKRAYRKMALKHHPDRNKGDKTSESKFKEGTEAYEVLSDPEKRKQYDTYGDYQQTPGGGGGAGGFGGFDFSGFQSSGGFGGFEDIFESFFGGGQPSRTRRAAKGEDIKMAMQITFEESAFGVEKSISIKRKESCTSCTGTGVEKGAKMKNCITCGGSGQVAYVQRSFLGNIRSVQICADCDGQGKIPESRCGTCHGQGRMDITDTMNIKIPAGIEDGMTIRLKDKGNVGKKGTSAGDLYIYIQVAPSKKFRREGNDIHTMLDVSNIQAVLGDEIEIDTIYGKKMIKIPKGIQHGEVIRLKELGIQGTGSYHKGDHFVAIHVFIPKKLSRKEEELYQEIMKIQKGEKKGWL